jgi:hypothetical protein
MSEEPFWTVAGLTGRIGVSAQSLKRWKRTRRVPRWAFILIALLAGELDQIDRAFTGWLLRNGELISPEGWRFTPGEIRSIPFLYGQVRLWRDEALSYRNIPFQQQLPLEETGHASAYRNDTAYPHCREALLRRA